ncbi:MAG: TetR/AcrR family transcriptional regulator [Nevskiaceae bacterium]|nr:MAG: TetR/AcrR family transcriptional regulator [Nevskiaceae bacterium]
MKKTASKREQNKLANRAAILEAAQQSFIEQGYDAVTVRDIIRKTGLAAGTFYNYFEDKAELLHALIEQHIGSLTTRLSATRRAATSIEQFLHDAYLAVFEEIVEYPGFYAMMFRNEPVIRAFYDDNVIGHTMLALKQDLRLAMARGVFPEMDADYLTAILGGAGYELARMMVERKGKKPEQAAAFATRLFLSGVQGFSATQGGGALIRRGSLKIGDAAR